LPIINKSKHPKKRGNAREKIEVPMTKKTKRTAKEVEPQGEHQVFEPPPIARSISNKERVKRVPE
jgi:hypothetical protein